MKMFLGNTPIKGMKIGTNTDDATLVASDLQAGVTAYAKGKKVTGTGKCFSFATYGKMETNLADYVPSQINVIEIASLDYHIKSLIAFDNMQSVDFSIEQTIGSVVIDSTEYPITVRCKNSILTLNCEKTITLEVFLGEDNYHD